VRHSKWNAAPQSNSPAERSMNPAPATPELLPFPPHDTLGPRRIVRRRGPSLSRRIGQAGNVFQTARTTWDPNASAFGRYWIDAPDGRKRKTVSLGTCRTRSVARQKLREHIAVTGVNDVQTFNQNTAPALTFKEQAHTWMASLRTRRRRPLKPATLLNWQNHLDKWILPTLGDMPLSEVGNTALRGLIDKMMEAGLGPKTVQNYSGVVKLVVASAVDHEGEPIFPRKWNAEFVGLPIIKKNDQHRPTFEASKVSTIVSSARKHYRVVFTTLAGSGLRAGELIGLKVGEDLSADCRTLNVRRSVWNGKEQAPKTENAVRVVDLPESLAALLRKHIAGRSSGYVFTTRKGRPLSQRNLLRVLHALAGKTGLHAFRRFRTSVLRKAGVPDDLIQLWLGHAGRSVTDDYARQLREDVPFRQEWAARVGLGFELGYVGLQNESPTALKQAA
jgi:integrase